MIEGPDWRRFPPLGALRAFEATARLQGFSAAARVLNVTPAAVAQQVRALEAHLGAELAFRSGRALALTPAGQRLAQAMTECFGQIESALADARARPEGGPLHVTMTPAFARFWLMPRLGGFWAAHPEVPLVIRSSVELSDLRREGLDLGIRFGAGRWPGVEAEPLMAATDLVVGAPSLVAALGEPTPEALRGVPWMLLDDVAEEAAALRAFGLELGEISVRTFPTGELCLAAAMAGYGLTFATDRVAAADIAAGRLVAVRSAPLAGLAYHIVSRPGPRRPEERKFVRWLKAQAAAEAAPEGTAAPAPRGRAAGG